MKEIKSIQNNLNNKQPSNIEAEQALIGSVLVNNDIIDEIEKVTGIDFLSGIDDDAEEQIESKVSPMW